MPIKPEQIAERRTKQREKDLNALYIRIDSALIFGRTLFKVPDDIDRKYVDDVVTAYREAGWSVHAPGGELDGSGDPVSVSITEFISPRNRD